MYNHTLKCVVPENAHTCLGKVVGNSEGGGGVPGRWGGGGRTVKKLLYFLYVTGSLDK